jgi:phage terminase small subunit
MTGKEAAFCLAYVKSPNAYQAAIQAGYTQTYAKIKSHKILERPRVVAEIKRLRTRMDQTAVKSATDVVNEYSRIAFSDRITFLKEDPWRPGEWMYKAPDELSEEQRAVVEKVNMTVREVEGLDENGEKCKRHRQEYRYTLSDKANALQQMGRHFGIFEDKLKLGPASNNPFANATQEQLEQLKSSWVKTMQVPAIEGQYTEVEDGS